MRRLIEWFDDHRPETVLGLGAAVIVACLVILAIVGDAPAKLYTTTMTNEGHIYIVVQTRRSHSDVVPMTGVSGGGNVVFGTGVSSSTSEAISIVHSAACPCRQTSP